MRKKAIPRDEYRQVLSRLDVLEHDVADIKTDIGELRGEMNGMRDEMNKRFIDMERYLEVRFDKMYDRMVMQARWLIGSIALLGTVISILLSIGLFVK